LSVGQFVHPCFAPFCLHFPVMKGGPDLFHLHLLTVFIFLSLSINHQLSISTNSGVDHF